MLRGAGIAPSSRLLFVNAAVQRMRNGTAELSSQFLRPAATSHPPVLDAPFLLIPHAGACVAGRRPPRRAYYRAIAGKMQRLPAILPDIHK